MNKTAVVTGASRGLGKHIVEALVSEKVKVYGLARTKTDLVLLEKELGTNFIGVCLDITQSDSISNWVNSTFSESNCPSILIQNAGIIHHATIENTSIEEWNTVMNVNMNAIFYLTKTLLPLMKSSGNPAHLIHIASIAGLIGNPELSLYNASKFALRGFSEALMKEVRSYGIKVTTLFPGSIQTQLFDSTSHFKGSPNKMNPKEIADLILFILKTSDNFLIDEITLRPLKPKG